MQDFSLNHLSDTEFEQYCYDLLAEMKFINLNWRKGTGVNAIIRVSHSLLQK